MVVDGVGTTKDITIYKVLYSANPRKITVRRTTLNLTLAQTHRQTDRHTKNNNNNKKKKKKKNRFSFRRHVKFSLCLVNMCRNHHRWNLRRLSKIHSHVDISFYLHVDVSFTRGGSFTSTGPVHTYMSRSHVEDQVTRRDPVYRLGIGCPWSSTCNLYLLV